MLVLFAFAIAVLIGFCTAMPVALSIPWIKGWSIILAGVMAGLLAAVLDWAWWEWVILEGNPFTNESAMWPSLSFVATSVLCGLLAEYLLFKIHENRKR